MLENNFLTHFKSKNYAQLYIDLTRDVDTFPTFVASNPDPPLNSAIVELCSAAGSGDGCFYLDYTGESAICLNRAPNIDQNLIAKRSESKLVFVKKCEAKIILVCAIFVD
jgi:hypothetical protein